MKIVPCSVVVLAITLGFENVIITHVGIALDACVVGSAARFTKPRESPRLPGENRDASALTNISLHHSPAHGIRGLEEGERERKERERERERDK